MEECGQICVSEGYSASGEESVLKKAGLEAGSHVEDDFGMNPAMEISALVRGRVGLD